MKTHKPDYFGIFYKYCHNLQNSSPSGKTCKKLFDNDPFLWSAASSMMIIHHLNGWHRFPVLNTAKVFKRDVLVDSQYTYFGTHQVIYRTHLGFILHKHFLEIWFWPFLSQRSGASSPFSNSSFLPQLVCNEAFNWIILRTASQAAHLDQVCQLNLPFLHLAVQHRQQAQNINLGNWRGFGDLWSQVSNVKLHSIHNFQCFPKYFNKSHLKLFA